MAKTNKVISARWSRLSALNLDYKLNNLCFGGGSSSCWNYFTLRKITMMKGRNIKCTAVSAISKPVQTPRNLGNLPMFLGRLSRNMGRLNFQKCVNCWFSNFFLSSKFKSDLRKQNVKEFFQNFKFEIENFKIKIFLKRSKLKIFEKFFQILFPWVILEFWG